MYCSKMLWVCHTLFCVVLLCRSFRNNSITHSVRSLFTEQRVHDSQDSNTCTGHVRAVITFITKRDTNVLSLDFISSARAQTFTVAHCSAALTEQHWWSAAGQPLKVTARTAECETQALSKDNVFPLTKEKAEIKIKLTKEALKEVQTRRRSSHFWIKPTGRLFNTRQSDTVISAEFCPFFLWCWGMVT